MSMRDDSSVGRRSMGGSTATGSTRTTKILIQNGSFFYPRRPGFRSTAVYTSALGEKDMVHYKQAPGGQQTVSLGADKAARPSSTIADSYRESALPESRARAARAPYAGFGTAATRERAERFQTKLVQPPGGRSEVMLGADENPSVSSGVLAADLAAGSDPSSLAAIGSLEAAGVTCAAVGADRAAKVPLQNVGGNQTVSLGSDASALPAHSLMSEDLSVAHNPALIERAAALPAHGVVARSREVEPARVTLLAQAGGGDDHISLKDGSKVPESTLWEADVARSFEEESRREAAEMPSAGVRVPDGPHAIRCTTVPGGPSHLSLNYATERDNASAALSPVRPRTIALNATRTHGGVRRVGQETVEAAGCVGPSLIGGPSPAYEDRWSTTYQMASRGEKPLHERPRRSLVRRVQNIGGATSVSLMDDAAGIPTPVESPKNPITATAPNPITAAPPAPIHTGRRFIRPLPLPDQVVITAADSERLRMREASARRPSIRAPPGGATTVALG